MDATFKITITSGVTGAANVWEHVPANLVIRYQTVAKRQGNEIKIEAE